MSPNIYLWMMRLGVLIALVAFVFVVIEVNPDETGIMGIILFYSSLFLLLSGVFVQMSLWIRRKYHNAQHIFAYSGISFRQSVLLAMLTIILLIMQSQDVLVWWDGLLVVIGVFFLELYFLMRTNMR